MFCDGIQVKAVGPTTGLGKCGQALRGAIEEAISSDLVSPGRMCHGDADLCKALPQVPFLDGSGLPTRLQYLVGGERTSCADEVSSCRKSVFGRQGLLRHRLDAHGPVGQRSAQGVARSCLPSAAFGVPVTITSRHGTSLPSGGMKQRGNRAASPTLGQILALGLDPARFKVTLFAAERQCPLAA